MTVKDSFPLFTVFTPTFNRARTLHRVYDSLCAQSFDDFEWLIIDDGSTDDTGEMVNKWISEADFQIRYFWQENQGKHIAFNHGVQEARGALFLPLDSDDGCLPNALERFKFHWDNLSAAEQQAFSAVTALCMEENGQVVGSKFPRDIFDSDSLEIQYKYRIKGEKWGFHRTEVLRCFPFPAIPGVEYMPEGMVWSAIARRYKTRFVNDVLRIYYQNGEQQGCEQLTQPSSAGKHAVSSMRWHRFVLNEQLDWFRYDPTRFLISAIHYSRFSFHAQEGIFDQIRKLKRPLGIMLYLICLPIGWLAYMHDAEKKC